MYWMAMLGGGRLAFDHELIGGGLLEDGDVQVAGRGCSC